MAEFKLYFQDADLGKHMEEYLHNGCTRFLFTRHKPHQFYLDNYRRIQAFFVGIECEVVHDRGDHMWRIRPGQQEKAPVWRMDSHDIESLQRIVAEKPETVYIEFISFSDRRAPKGILSLDQKLIIKQFYEVVSESDCEFILFGVYRFAPFFQSPIQGCAIRARSYTKSTKRDDWLRLSPDGAYWQNSQLRRALSIASRYRQAQIHAVPGVLKKRPNGVDYRMIRTIMTAQITKDYQRQMAEIELEQPYDAVKLLPDYFFPSEDMFADPVPIVGRPLPLLAQALPGDRIVCSACSLKYRCPVYDPEGVCVVPDTEGKALADHFNTRDSKLVLTGLQAILSKQAERVEGAVTAEEKANQKRAEEEKPPLYSEQVTKMLDGLQKNGERYLKLVDPRFTKPLVQINQASINQPPAPRDIDPATARDELVAAGLPPDKINADVIQRYLDGTYNGPRELAAGHNVIDGDTFPADF